MPWVAEVGGQGFLVARFSGEVGVKSGRVRAKYERWVLEALLERLKRAGVGFGEPHYEFGRIYLPVGDVEAALREASKVFGISSASPALKASSRREDVVELAVKVAKAALPPGARFAVKCRRVGKHEYSSQELARLIGRAVLKELRDRGIRVDLDRPEVVVGVEVRGGDAYVYVGEQEGPRGLPLGCQGRVVCLLSDGLRSPVAAWMMMKRGCMPILLHFNLEPYASPEEALRPSRALASWTPRGRLRLYVARHGEVLRRIEELSQPRLTCLLCRRAMLRVARRLAELRGALGLVAGDVMGEPPSLSLSDLPLMDGAAEGMPVYRPLAGMDAAQVEALAKRVGTYEASARVEASCPAAPRGLEAKASLAEVVEAEEALRLREAALEEAERLEERVVEA